MNNTELEVAVQSASASWMRWAQETSNTARYDFEADLLVNQAGALLGYFIQACAEQPDDFARVFAPVLGVEATNPLTSLGEGALVNLVRNGVCDDWEIYLQWREDGYVVVPERDRRPQDVRLGFAQARLLLDNITGGPVQAPGAADVVALVQSMYETESPARRYSKA